MITKCSKKITSWGRGWIYSAEGKVHALHAADLFDLWHECSPSIAKNDPQGQN